MGALLLRCVDRSKQQQQQQEQHEQQERASPMYSNMKESALSTPFCTFSSGTRYSFISAGSTVNGLHVSGGGVWGWVGFKFRMCVHARHVNKHQRGLSDRSTTDIDKQGVRYNKERATHPRRWR